MRKEPSLANQSYIKLFSCSTMPPVSVFHVSAAPPHAHSYFFGALTMLRQASLQLRGMRDKHLRYSLFWLVGNAWKGIQMAGG